MADTDADRLTEISNREQAATAGPWELYDSYGPNFYGYLRGDYLQGVGDLVFGEGSQADADRAFTINARTDIPYLLAALHAMTTERDELATKVQILEAGTGVNQLADRVNPYVDRCNRLRDDL